MEQLLNGRYALGDVIGSGGNGAVHRATDTALGREVAVKVLRGGPLADDTAKARMRSEARLAASVHHPGIASVYDFDDDCATHGGLAFIVMQLVQGWSLAELLRREGALPADQVMSVVVQVAEALQVAHDAGIVHRDLKPANIMVTPAGRTVLVDFGIARGATSEPLTETGALIGTADYLSPEQAAGRTATTASDLYALGVVAHHCLTGTSPFRRESHVATALAHLNDDLPPLPADLPPGIRDLVADLTAKDPARRPASAREVAARAAAIGASTGVDLPAGVPPRAPLHTSPASRTDHLRPTIDPRRRRPGVVFAGVVVAAVVAALLVYGGRGDGHVVPDVVGLGTSEATARIEAAGLVARTTVVDVAGTPKGEVVRQSPDDGATRPDRGTVRIWVVSGRVKVSSRALIGLSYAKASARLEDLGLVVRREDVTRATDVGEVVALDRSGRLVDGSTVTLSVAVAPAPVAAPTTSTSSGGSGTASRASSGGHGGKGGSKGKGRGKGKH